MEVTTAENLSKFPPCTCGKCIIRRCRNSNFGQFPYDKDLSSQYKIDYNWKKGLIDNPDEYYIRSKHNVFEGQYKESLPTEYISTMKMSYKPFKVKIDKTPRPKPEPMKRPLIGRSVYRELFNNWGSLKSSLSDSEDNKMPDIRIPFKGESDYVANYKRYEDDIYKNKTKLLHINPSLKFTGELKGPTIYQKDYQPHQHRYCLTDNYINAAKGGSAILKSGPLSSFETTYFNDYIKYDDSTCKLRKKLNSLGKSYLII